MSSYKSKFIFYTLILGVVLFTSIVLLYKNANLSSPFFMLAMIFVAFILLYLITIAQMVRTGRLKAKGAKKRRRRLLPLLYKKKPKPASYQLNRNSPANYIS